MQKPVAPSQSRQLKMTHPWPASEGSAAAIAVTNKMREKNPQSQPTSTQGNLAQAGWGRMRGGGRSLEHLLLVLGCAGGF